MYCRTEQISKSGNILESQGFKGEARHKYAMQGVKEESFWDRLELEESV